MLRVLHYKTLRLCDTFSSFVVKGVSGGGLDLAFKTGALTACVLVAGRCGQGPSGCMLVLTGHSIAGRAVRKRATYRHTGLDVHAYTGIQKYTFTGIRVCR